MAKKGFFILFGRPGGGKSSEAARTFQKAFYLKTAPNILQFFDVMRSEAGLWKDVSPPVKECLLDVYSVDGNITLGQDGMPLKVPQRATFEVTLDAIMRAGFAAKAANKTPPVEHFVIDEMGELWNRVFNEFASTTISEKSQKQDLRGAFGLMGKWSQEVCAKLSALTTVDIGVVGVLHDQEPNAAEEKRGGPKLTSQAIKNEICARADVVMHRMILDEEIGKPPVNKWRGYGSQWWDTKVRGISNEELRRMYETNADLVEYVRKSGFSV